MFSECVRPGHRIQSSCGLRASARPRPSLLYECRTYITRTSRTLLRVGVIAARLLQQSNCISRNIAFPKPSTDEPEKLPHRSQHHCKSISVLGSRQLSSCNLIEICTAAVYFFLLIPHPAGPGPIMRRVNAVMFHSRCPQTLDVHNKGVCISAAC